MYANGFKYWLAYKKGTSGYYRCSRYKSGCPGRCVIDDGEQDTTGTVRNSITPHNHPPEPDRRLVDQFRRVLTRRAATESTDLHVIYLEEAMATGRHAEASLLYTFSQAESCMRKARRKMFPREPGSIGELKDVLESDTEMFRIHCGSDRDVFYQSTIVSEGYSGVILWHRKTIEALGRIEELYLDAGVVVTSPTAGRHNLLIGLVRHQQTCIPVFYSVMSAKTYSGYAAVFAYVREQLGKLIAPSLILTEPDSEMHRALELTFPEATVKVYWYHYTTAVVRQMRQLGLSQETTKGYGYSALRMLLVVPLLPASCITPGFEALKKWIKDKDVFTEHFSHLCDYVEQSWINLVSAKRLSMFGHAHSTCSHVKNFIKSFGSQENLRNCSIWQALECLTQLATKQYVQITKRAKRSANEHPTKLKKKVEQVQETVIASATEQWIKTADHLRNPLQFLQLCSHCISDSMITESFPNSSACGGSNSDNKPALVPSTSALEPIRSVTHVAFPDMPSLLAIDEEAPQSNHLSEAIVPTREPPPLAFFSKVQTTAERRTSGITPLGPTEPPPLLPFSVLSTEERLPRYDTGEVGV